MKFVRRDVAQLDRCYCTNSLVLDNRQAVVYASEASPDQPGDAYALFLDDLSNKELIWNNAGGCMSILQHPYHQNQFIAVQEFYLKQPNNQAKLVIGQRNEDKTYSFHDLLTLPYLHRFGFLQDSQGYAHLIVCTIAKAKEHKEDWSQPGEVWTGILEKDNTIRDWKLIKTGLYHNHGFYYNQFHGQEAIYLGSDQGIHRVYLKQDQVEIEQLLTTPVGEIALADLKGDGIQELMTIEPFHGDTIKIYQQKEMELVPVWKLNREIEFAHALTGGQLLGKSCFIAGVRRKNAETLVITWNNDEYQVHQVDQGAGAANCCLITTPNHEYISCANHTAGYCSLYEVEEK